jgi:lipoprotein-anchoring transpeptidase ErfK/SrfK
MYLRLRCGARVSSQAPAYARQALLAGIAAAFVTGVVSIGFADRAQAQFRSFQYQSFQYQSFEARPPLPIKPKPRPASKGGGTKAEPAKDFGPMPKGPLQIVVSIANQHVTLYSGGIQVAQGPVSTGIPGKPTPTGVFSIIQKDRYHHSNLYSNAPMPYMERITWSGVALHEGPLPGYPASHGCIRMTHEFAAKLWVIARLGVRVVVARNDVVPVEFSHPRLFAPKEKPAEPPVAGNTPAQRAGSLDPVKVARAETAATDVAERDRQTDAGGAAAPPSMANALRGAGVPESRATAEAPLAFDTAGAPIEPAVAAPAGAVETSSESEDPPKPAPDAVDPIKTPPPTGPKGRPLAQPLKHSGEVAVFISRREKKLYVRQGFVPLFDAPVTIEHPEQPFGTHVFTAVGPNPDGTGMRWNLMSMPGDAPRAIAPKIGAKATSTRPPESFPPQTAAEVLDRIEIPTETIDRISEILTPGSSLVVSDAGLGPETGTGTGFVVLTH